MSDKTPVIRQHASNLGNIKGLPKGSGQGGYFFDTENIPSNAENMRDLFARGHVVHVQDNDKNDYILKDFMAGDNVQVDHICNIKLSDARKKGVAEDLNDIISGVDTINVNDVVLKGTFSDEEDALNYFLIDTEKMKYEGVTKFDTAINDTYKKIIR